jgi:hypothetical protein
MGVNLLVAFSLEPEAQRKSFQKKRQRGISPSAEGDRGSAPRTAPPFEKRRAKTFMEIGVSVVFSKIRPRRPRRGFW